MKRSGVGEALEVWFDVERYEAIGKLTLQHFYVKIEWCILACRVLLNRNTIPTFNRLMLDDYRNKTLSGEIFLSDDTATFGHEPARIYIVNPTMRSHTQFYAKTLALAEAMPGLSELSQSESLSEYLKEIPLNNFLRITVDIYLEEAPTEEVIEHLRALIPR